MAFSSIEGLERSRKSTSGKSTGMRIAEILREELYMSRLMYAALIAKVGA